MCVYFLVGWPASENGGSLARSTPPPSIRPAKLMIKIMMTTRRRRYLLFEWEEGFNLG